MKVLLLPMLLLVFEGVHAQNKIIQTAKIKGLLAIGEQERRLPNATIMLLYFNDSAISKVTFSDESGSFVLDGISKGDYNLYIQSLGYKAVWRMIRIAENDIMIDIGTILMQEQGITLGIVEIVSQRSSMVAKRDTLEFDADAFKTREHAMVEELLKRLPGVEIGIDGIIKLNGVVVNNLLVDGKPFFADNPTIAIGNLTADMIDKVQFIDRRSDWSQFAGINDGKREKTINITIKKNKKNSYLGWVGGTLAKEDRFAVNGNINKFTDHQQIGFFIGGTDINGYREKGGQGSVLTGGHSDIRAWSGNGLYNKDFGQKLKIRSTYSTADSDTEDKRSSERQSLLPDTTWYYNRRSNSRLTSNSHVLGVNMELQPAVSQILNLTTKVSYGTGRSIQENLYASVGGKGQLINSGAVRNEGISKALNFVVTGSFGMKFRKAGRTLSIHTGIKYSTNNQQSINKSDNSFIGAGGNIFSDTVDQKVNGKGITGSMSLSFTYTEPLIRNYYLELTYRHTHDYGTSNRLTYDFNPSKKVYDRRNDSLSNLFLNKSSLHQADIKILAQKMKYEYSLGLIAQFVRLNNKSINEHVHLQQHAVAFFPSVRFNYFFDSSKQLQFLFLGDTRQPNTLQLQPVPDNSNPLYIQLGNPNLKPTFNGNFNVKYSNTNATKLRMFSMAINYDLFINNIVDAVWFDSLGRQVSQPLNIDGSFIISTSISTNFPISKRRASVNTEISMGYIRDVSYINKVKEESRTLNISPGLNYHYSHKKLFDIGVDINANYKVIQYSIQQKKINFLNYTILVDNNIHLPFGIIIGESMIYKLNTGQVTGYDGSVIMLNAFISKTLFKGRQGLVRLQVADLLNDNTGFTRRMEVGYIENVQTTVAQRLFMIGFTYFFKNERK